MRFLRNFCGRYFRYVSPKPQGWVGGVRCLGIFPKKNRFFLGTFPQYHQYYSDISDCHPKRPKFPQVLTTSKQLCPFSRNLIHNLTLESPRASHIRQSAGKYLTVFIQFYLSYFYHREEMVRFHGSILRETGIMFSRQVLLIFIAAQLFIDNLPIQTSTFN